MKFLKTPIGRAACSVLVLGAVTSSTAVAGIKAGQQPMAIPDGRTDRLIVKFKDANESVVLNGRTILQARGVEPAQLQARVDRMSRAAQAHGTRLYALRQTGMGAHVFQLSSAMSEQDALALARSVAAADPNVEYAEPDRKMYPMLVPNDSQYNSQWDLFEATGGIRAPAAWDKATGSGVVVAVLDTGIRPHADLSGQIVPGYDMINDPTVGNDGNGRDSDGSDPGDWSTGSNCQAGDSSWHGTHVAGTIAAKTNNSQGIAGIAFNAKVQSVRVLGVCGGYTSDIADGIIWAAGGSVSGAPANATPAKVLNLSLGGGGSCDSTTQAAINSARARGAVVVVAAGNSNANASGFTPANCSGVVSVAATGRTGGRASYSNYGTVVDLAAPGGDTSTGQANGILSTLNAGRTTPGADNYVYYQGTSMAAPHVAGVAALMLSVKPDATPDQIESTLKSTARAFPATCSGCGTGILDANAAVTAITGGGGDTPGLPVISGQPANVAVNVGQTATFRVTASSSAALRYQWKKNGVNISGATAASYTTPATTAADNGARFSVDVSNATGTTSSASATLTVNSGGGSGTTVTGNLGFAGASATYPANANGYHNSTAGGSFTARLSGPAGTDFDLYLYKWTGSAWSVVAKSEGASSTESYSYNGTSGFYYIEVRSYSGSGSFTLTYTLPR